MSSEEYIAKQLKKARIQSGLSIKDAAEKMDLNYRTVHSWEEDGKQPTASKLIKACEVYNIPSFEYFYVNLNDLEGE